MKSVISAVTIFILIIILVITSYMYTESTTNTILQNISDIKISISKDEWNNAMKKMSNNIKQWQNKRDIMEVFVDHSVVDEVDYSMVRLKTAVEFKDTEMFFEEYGKAKLLLSGLMEQQKVSISNLF